MTQPLGGEPPAPATGSAAAQAEEHLLATYRYLRLGIVVAVLCWFPALVTGRVPRGLRDLGAVALRYQAQVYAYTLLVTSRYPDSSPALVAPPERPLPPALEPAEVV